MTNAVPLTWKAILGVVLGAAISLIAVDYAFWQLRPPHPLRQVEDALSELKTEHPDVLVMSSSHGRSFHVIGRELERRTDGGVHLLSIPLEGGHMRAMSWVLTHRVAPLLDQREDKPSELIFGVTWWDTCRRHNAVPEFEPNVVSRAWTVEDYAANVARDGLTDVNRNYASYRWQQLLSFSSLIQRRATLAKQDLSFATLFGPVVTDHGRAAPPTRSESALLKKWRTDIETGHECLFSPSEMHALDDVWTFARDRHMALTVVLFPLKPATVTEAGVRQTLQPFSKHMQEIGQREGFRVIDLTRSPVLDDDDFMADFDHVTADGNRKLAEWALAHQLGYLLQMKRLHAAAHT